LGSLDAVAAGLVADLPRQTEWTRSLSSAAVAAALDESTLLVLPSRSEGMGRVIAEAFCRGRPVLGANVGGIADLVRDGENGLLVAPEDPSTLADALVDVLGNRELAERLAEGTRTEDVRGRIGTDEYAARLGALVERIAPPTT
jgi:glycosyltransferase involved in cell wall biosynthesis